MRGRWRVLQGGRGLDRLALRVQINGGIAVGSGHRGMAQPMADRGKVDAGLEQMYGRAMTNRVWMQLLVGQAGGGAGLIRSSEDSSLQLAVVRNSGHSPVVRV